MVTNSSTKLLGLSPRRKNAIFFLRASVFLGQELPELPERDLTISLLPSEKELLSSYTNHSLVSKHHPQAQKTPLLSQRRVCHRETAQAVLRRFSAPKSKKRPDPEDSAIGHKVELSCADLLTRFKHVTTTTIASAETLGRKYSLSLPRLKPLLNEIL